MKARMLTVRLDEELHRDVRVKAAVQGRHVAVIVRALLRQWADDQIETDEPNEER